MTALESFNNLHGREVPRKEVESLLEQAKAENNTAIVYRLSKLLRNSPDATHFEITITQYEPAQGLLGVQHTGDYKEALDDCGRLRKGWKFVGGNVVKVAPKPKKEKKPTYEFSYKAKDFKYPIPKSVKDKFRELGWKYDRKRKEWHIKTAQFEPTAEMKQMRAFIDEEFAKIEQKKNASKEKAPKKAVEKAKDTEKGEEKYDFLWRNGLSKTQYFIYSYSNILNKPKTELPKEGDVIIELINKDTFEKKFKKYKGFHIEKGKAEDYLQLLKRENQGLSSPALSEDHFKTLKEAKKYYLKWALEHLRGEKVYHKELKKWVLFNRAGIEHTLSSKISYEKMKLILQAKEMLINSHLITFEEEYKGRDNIAGVYRMKSNAMLEGEEVDVILTLREGENGVIYYDHKIEKIERNAIPPRKGHAKSFCGDSVSSEGKGTKKSVTSKQKDENFGLHAPRHEGVLKDALNECGRLRKGWKFEKGTAVKVETKKGKVRDVAKKADKKESTKSVKPTKTTKKETAKVQKEAKKAKEAFLKKRKRAILEKAETIYRNKQNSLDDIFKPEPIENVVSKLNEFARINALAGKNLDFAKFDKLKSLEAKRDYIQKGAKYYSLTEGEYYSLLKDAGDLGELFDFIPYETEDKTNKKEKGKAQKEEDGYTKFKEREAEREKLFKRAEVYRRTRENGHSYEEVYKRAKELDGKEADLIMNISYLNPMGKMKYTFLNSFEDEEKLFNMLNWAGEARRLYPLIANSDEDDMARAIYGTLFETKNKSYFFESIKKGYPRIERANYAFNKVKKKYNIDISFGDFRVLYSSIRLDFDKDVAKQKVKYYQIPDWMDSYTFFLKIYNDPITKIFKDAIIKDFASDFKKGFVKPNVEYHYKVQLNKKGILIVNDFTETLKEFDEKKGLSAPEVSTERFKKMKVSELRAFTLRYYNLFLKGDRVTIEKYLKEVVFINTAGRKIALGEAMYSAKAAVITHLKTLIKNSTYNNWGDRKISDGKDVLGYLNFKSKITIDKIKRHVRISLVVYKDRRTELKNVEVGKKKKTFQPTQDPVGTLQDGRVETLSGGKVTKKSVTSKQNNENFGLQAPEISIVAPTNRRTLAQQLANRSQVRENFIVSDEQLSKFLGALERKRKDSLVIALTGKQGSGKTRFAFQFLNALAQQYNVGHASIEEHPESILYEDKAFQYLSDTALEHITAQDVRSLEELDEMIRMNDVIVIDSFQKMREIFPRFEVDKDLRKKYDGKLFLVIFQQTADGKMRGGSKSQFDGDIVLFTQTFPDYRENYVYPDKNRYNSIPATELKYNIFQQRMLPVEGEDVPTLAEPQEPATAVAESEELNFDVM